MFLMQHTEALDSSDKSKISSVAQISYCSVNLGATMLAQIKFPYVVQSWVKNNIYIYI